MIINTNSNFINLLNAVFKNLNIILIYIKLSKYQYITITILNFLTKL